MTDSIFDIGAEGIDKDKIIDEISAEAAKKRAAGIYNKAKEAYKKSVNLNDIKDDDEHRSLRGSSPPAASPERSNGEGPRGPGDETPR